MAAQHWLFDRRILIPGDRQLQDCARDAFASYEAQMLAVVAAAVRRQPCAAARNPSTAPAKVRQPTSHG